LKTNIIMDCHYVCWSSSFALPEMSTDDQEVGVIYGFLKQVLALSKKFETNNFYFCWDSRKSYRKLMFPDYKRKRSDKKKELSPEDLARIMMTHEQISKIRESVLPEIGFNNSFMKTGYEADDLICHLSRGLEGKNIIVSSDEDLYQLLDENVIMYKIKGGKRFGIKDLAKKYRDVTPQEWVDVKALGGCKSDEVPGIEGVGAIKAIKYIKGEMKSGVVKGRIESEEGKEIYRRNLELVKLPLHEGKFDITNDVTQDSIDRRKLRQVFDRYEFASFLRHHVFEDWINAFER